MMMISLPPMPLPVFHAPTPATQRSTVCSWALSHSGPMPAGHPGIAKQHWPRSSKVLYPTRLMSSTSLRGIYSMPSLKPSRSTFRGPLLAAQCGISQEDLMKAAFSASPPGRYGLPASGQLHSPRPPSRDGGYMTITSVGLRILNRTKSVEDKLTTGYVPEANS